MLATPDFARVVVARPCRELHADVEHRQVVVLDEVDARPARGLPVLDGQYRPRRGRREKQNSNHR